MMVQRPQSEQFWKIIWVICYPFVAIGMGQNIRPWSHNILGLVSFKCSHLWPPNFDPRFVFLWNVPPQCQAFSYWKKLSNTIPYNSWINFTWFILVYPKGGTHRLIALGRSVTESLRGLDGSIAATGVGWIPYSLLVRSLLTLKSNHKFPEIFSRNTKPGPKPTP